MPGRKFGSLGRILMGGFLHRGSPDLGSVRGTSRRTCSSCSLKLLIRRHPFRKPLIWTLPITTGRKIARQKIDTLETAQDLAPPPPGPSFRTCPMEKVQPIHERRIWNFRPLTQADSHFQGVEFPGPKGIICFIGVTSARSQPAAVEEQLDHARRDRQEVGVLRHRSQEHLEDSTYSVMICYI